MIKAKVYLIDTPLIEEFDFENNPGIAVDEVTVNSGRKVNWRCKKGHSWSAIVANRSRGNNCPYCSGRRAIPGETDLGTVYPELAKEFDIENNSDIRLEELSAHSAKKVNWKCEKGHTWSGTVINRSKGNSCPYCSGKKAIPGETDLMTINPRLAKEFDSENNPGIKLEELTACSSKKVNWKCKEGHMWSEKVANRAHGRNCPYCSGHRVIIGKTGLNIVNPKLAEEFDVENNPEIKVEELSAYSNRKVYWRCKKGHVWNASVNSRANGYACPYCAGYKAIPGETDLKTVNPKLAEEFDAEKNSGIRIEELTAYSNKRVYWKCKKGHRWKTQVSTRSRGRDCPYCAKKRVLPGETDLKTVNPELAEEFDIENNHGIRIEELSAYSTKKVAWRCERGHMWKAAVAQRTKGSGCPVCSGRKKIQYIGNTCPQ